MKMGNFLAEKIFKIKTKVRMLPIFTFFSGKQWQTVVRNGSVQALIKPDAFGFQFQQNNHV